MEKELVKNVCANFESILKKTKTSKLEIQSIDIDCSLLPNSFNKNPRDFDYLKPIFLSLDADNTKPTLYWFEVISEQSTEYIYDEHLKFKKLKKRSTPAVKKDYPRTSKIIYVGKVKKDFRGRLYVHLGYYKNKNTQGIQLYHWAKPINLKVKLNYIEFDYNMSPLMQVIENELAKSLRPFLGRHR